ncbi:MAG: thioredoxin [Rhodobacterales bacterium TMED271]|nr:MAG: thioredoxin [Rhodobacterales bacterium TMED271]|tara:strand:- start:14 stop:883 length:870 start_codon:yes stop_codon:yes gene_type:complete
MTTETIKSVSEATFVSDVIEKSKEKIMIVDFWAPWCGPCKALTPILERQAFKRKEQLEVVKVNIDENQAIASQLRIQSIPAVFAFSDGQPVDGFMGAKSEPEVEKFFETLIKKFSKKVVDETEEINNLLLEERFEDAKIVLEQLIRSNPSPENFSLLIKSLIGLKNFDEIEQIIKGLSPDIIKDSMVQVAISSYELLKNSHVESSKSEILDKINKNPSDLDAKMNYSKILLQENNFSECIDVLLEMFKEDREWREGLAKKQLLSIFEHLGSDDALSKKGRRSLTSLIFV